jgi:plastocyanin
MRRLLALISTLALTMGLVLVPSTGQAQAKPSLKVISPTEGALITTTDIPAQVEVSNFKLSASDVGLPDVDGEGHIHVMIDGMNMGVLFNFFTTPTFTLLGDAIPPGKHTLIFDLAGNTHMDMEDTVQHVTIDYEPTSPRPAPAAIPNPGSPIVRITSPADGATVDPKFTLQVDKSNFNPSLGLEGKPNLSGFGHYHVMVDMDVFPMMMMGGMMAMDGMVVMAGSDSIPLDLSAWPPGKHTITVEAVQNDHTPIEGAKEGMITINLQDSAGAPRAMDGLTLLGQNAITQAMFTAVWGDRASLRWASEHNHDLEKEMGMGGGMPSPAPAPAPAPAPGAAPAAAAPAPAMTASEVKIVEPAFQPPQAWTYDPAQVNVKVGQTVTWTNSGAVAHTVTADDGTSFDSGTLAPGATFKFTPTTAGTFAYHCTFHPWMKATLSVSS